MILDNNLLFAKLHRMCAQNLNPKYTILDSSCIPNHIPKALWNFPKAEINGFNPKFMLEREMLCR